MADFSSLVGALTDLGIMIRGANTQTASNTIQLRSLLPSVTTLDRSMKNLAGGIENLGSSINKLYSVQERLGVSIDTAFDVKLGSFVESLKSNVNAIKNAIDAVSGKEAMTTAVVSPEEIIKAQAAFQREFGEILTSESARSIAEQAKRYGTSAQDIAKSTRVFTTATAGDLRQAVGMQEKFLSTFKEAGIKSAAIAMETISKYGNLIAQNGVKFADSFARAAAEAKKIGVDLGKIDAVGDNIINNFESFLESQAELGAMGFGFDTTRLAEVAYTGDTGAMLSELQSQLAATGKNLQNLTRPERLAIESAFGMSIGELQRMAAGKPETPPMRKLENNTEYTNSILLSIRNYLQEKFPTLVPKYDILTTFLEKHFEKILYALAGSAGVIGVLKGVGIGKLIPSNIFSTLYGPRGRAAVRVRRATQTAQGLIQRIPNIFGRAVPSASAGMSGSKILAGADKLRNFLARSVEGSKAVSSGLVGRIGGVATGAVSRVGIGGMLQGLFSAVEGFKTAKEKGAKTSTALGAGATQAGFGIAGAAILTPILGPLGTMIGGILGDRIGAAINKYIPGVASAIGDLFTGIAGPFIEVKNMFTSLYTDSIKPLVSEIGELIKTITGSDGFKATMKGISYVFSDILGPVLKGIGTIVGTMLVAPFKALGMTIGVVIDVVRALVALFNGEWRKSLEFVGSAFMRVIDFITSPFKKIFNFFKEDLSASQERAERESAKGMGISYEEYRRKFGKATGGLVSGPGTSTSDNILTPLSPGEYIMNARSVELYGVGAMNAMNAGTLNTTPTTVQNNIELNLRPLEEKLNDMVRAIGNMRFELDGIALNRGLVNISTKASSVGTFKLQTVETYG